MRLGGKHSFSANHCVIDCFNFSLDVVAVVVVVAVHSFHFFGSRAHDTFHLSLFPFELFYCFESCVVLYYHFKNHKTKQILLHQFKWDSSRSLYVKTMAISVHKILKRPMLNLNFELKEILMPIQLGLSHKLVIQMPLCGAAYTHSLCLCTNLSNVTSI